MLQEIDRLLTSIEIKVDNIEASRPQLESTLGSLREAERLALRWLVVARRMGLPEEIDAATNKISRLIIALYMAQRAFDLMFTGTPFGIAFGLAGIFISAFTVTDAFAGY